jgi:hypothetical protein
MKQAGEARRGGNRQEGEKPWRRKGCGLGKVAAGVKALAPLTSRKGLAVLIALKGRETSREASSREWATGLERDAERLRAGNVVIPTGSAVSAAQMGGRGRLWRGAKPTSG